MALKARRFSPAWYLWMALGAAVVAVAAHLAVRLVAPPPDELDLSRSKTTLEGHYIAAIEPGADPVPQGTPHAWILALTDADGAPVTEAEITIDGGMPAHGHGLPTEPRVSNHPGDGRYEIDGIQFNMAGHWVLRLGISGPAGDDEVVFNIML